jgi:D-alanyl-D-alanine carboxypeptidase
LAATAVSSSTADARGRRHHQEAAAEEYSPSTASIVVDANSGAVMQATNADSPRHPASLTKIMTLYLLFERLEAGKIKLSSEMPVSPHAAAQAPSKLELKPGQTVDVETAIRAIVTKSANDVAVVVAEAIGGTEEDFARLMTQKAHALGMVHTNYHNASGLPDELQMTTARDQALLGRAIQDRFPKYYQYFSTRTFTFRGKQMRNHNHLLGAVTGVDGIKTGYIRESGFNIITSVRRTGRHIVAVVFGGRTAEARDARMRSLIENNINVASLKRTAPVIAEGTTPEPARKEQVVAVAAAPAAPAVAGPQPGSTDPIKPIEVKTFTVKPGAVHTASLSTTPMPTQKLTPAPATADAAKVTTIAIVKADVPTLPPPPGARPGVLGTLPVTKVASAGDAIPVSASAPAPVEKSHAGGWMIQVGAFDDEQEAKQRLTNAQIKAKDQLAQAEQFTERVAKGDKSMYRARFAGLDKEQAETACKNLKRSEIPCMLLRN